MCSIKFAARRTQSYGFTAIELLVVIAILGVLAALAAPSFLNSVRRYQVNAIRDELVNSLQLARIEAMRRGVPVILSRKTGCATTLTGTSDWSCGYTMYPDINNNSVQDTSNNEVTLTNASLVTNYGLIHSGTGNNILQVNLWGQAAGTGHSFVITSPAGASGPSVVVCVSTGGRVRTINNSSSCS